ncbi:hypothetical protein NLX83_24240 [Allokutzneria sp. A3M-2-11 16]|uniref:hypothetical protein n=1 Tax=Allokutzneria sp. A3M-2-11 16 TaxID=2962043 RepID=UPI0020B7E9F6|nr:hypothetical protein [Allokutzneria sp. A3M-2-11 16]MCP3802382.1 hypothetical protein [Allokutzneria sp. A3M-2-11 16]
MREALGALVHLGLLEARVGDGTYVRSSSELSAVLQRRAAAARREEVLGLRAILEEHASSLAAAHRSEADLASLESLLVEPVLAVSVLGLGGGVCLVLALGFQSQRAADHGQAAALAGMAQSIGYLVAAAGPLLLGVLHDATGGWVLPLALLGAISLVMAVVGYGAGRERHVAAEDFQAQSSRSSTAATCR